MDYQLLWCDIETTGTDRKLDHVLEVACFITDENLNIIDESFKVWLIDPGNNDWKVRLIDNPVVLEMHSKNGLIKDLTDSSRSKFRPISFVTDFYSYLGKHQFGASKYRMAGSGVAHFDKDFLTQYCDRVCEETQHSPQTSPFYDETLFDYATIDVGHVRRFLRDVVGREDLLPPDEGVGVTHRAFDDICDHYKSAVHYKNVLGSITCQS